MTTEVSQWPSNDWTGISLNPRKNEFPSQCRGAVCVLRLTFNNRPGSWRIFISCLHRGIFWLIDGQASYLVSCPFADSSDILSRGLKVIRFPSKTYQSPHMASWHWAYNLLSLVLLNCWKHWMFKVFTSCIVLCICSEYISLQLSRAVSRCGWNIFSVNIPLRCTGLQIRQWLHLRCPLVVLSINSFNTID